MTDMTPETLRLLADDYRGHADAWEADRERMGEMECELAGQALMDAEADAFLPEVVKQLREHIGALERQLRHMRRWSRGNMAGLTADQVAYAMRRMCDVALRGAE